MKQACKRLASTIVAAAMVSGCASSPKSIKAAYVSPLKYQDLSCDKIGDERTAILYHSNVLYHSLRKRADTDAAVMGVGAVLFLPALFFLKGNNAKAAEFAELQGDYHALRLNSEQRGCAIDFPDIRKAAASKDRPPVPVDTAAAAAGPASS